MGSKTTKNFHQTNDSIAKINQSWGGLHLGVCSVCQYWLIDMEVGRLGVLPVKVSNYFFNFLNLEIGGA
jgi:hypothetical protein